MPSTSRTARLRQNADEVAPGISLLARAILDEAPDKYMVVLGFLQQLMPSGWSGTLTSKVEPRVNGMISLTTHNDPLVRQAVARVEEKLQLALASACDHDKRYQVDDKRFE
jgi:hypothetical protein